MSSDGVRFYFTDKDDGSSASNTRVQRGPQGPPGPQGPQGPAGEVDYALLKQLVDSSQTAGDIQGPSDNFEFDLEADQSIVLELSIGSTDWKNRIIQLFRKDCVNPTVSCPQNYLCGVPFSYSFDDVKDVDRVSGVCIERLTDRDMQKVVRLHVDEVCKWPPVGATVNGSTTINSDNQVPLLKCDSDPCSGTCSALFKKSVSTSALHAPTNGYVAYPPCQQAFLYINSKAVAGKDCIESEEDAKSAEKVKLKATALRITFPDEAEDSGFDSYVDDERRNGYLMGVSDISTYIPANYQFCHAVNRNVDGLTPALSRAVVDPCDADACDGHIPHTNFRFEWQSRNDTNSTSMWKTLLCQQECTTTEGFVIFPLPQDYYRANYDCLDKSNIGVGDDASPNGVGGDNSWRLAVTRYAEICPSRVVDSPCPNTDDVLSDATFYDTVKYKNIPCGAFALAEIELVGTPITSDDDCDGFFVWTAIQFSETPGVAGDATGYVKNNVGRLQLQQPISAPGVSDLQEERELEVTNFSTKKHTYRVHVISPNSGSTTA